MLQIQVGNIRLSIELEPQTTILEIGEFLKEGGYVENEKPIAIEFQGRIFEKGVDTIKLIIGNTVNASIRVLAGDEISQFTTPTVLPPNNNFGPPSDHNLNQNNNFNPNPTNSLPPIRLGPQNQQQQNSEFVQYQSLVRCIFIDQSTSARTLVDVNQDQTVEHAISLLSQQLGVQTQSIIVYNQENTQLQNNQLQAKVSQFQDGNNQYPYKLTDQAQQQASRLIKLNFLFVNGDNQKNFSMNVQANLSMIDIKENLNEYLGYNKESAEIEYYYNAVPMPPGKLSRTPAELNLINNTIEIRVKWIGG